MEYIRLCNVEKATNDVNLFKFCPKKVKVSVLINNLECMIVLMSTLYTYIYLFIYLSIYLYVCVCVVGGCGCVGVCVCGCVCGCGCGCVCVPRGQHGVALLKTLSLKVLQSKFLHYFDAISFPFTSQISKHSICYNAQLKYACDAKTCPLKSNANCRKLKSQ